MTPAEPPGSLSALQRLLRRRFHWIRGWSQAYDTGTAGCAGGHQERHLPIAGPEAGGANGPGQFNLLLAGGGSRFTWMFSSASVG